MIADSDQIIYLLSDATGETAEKMVLAALSQFRGHRVKLKQISNVRNKNQVYEVLDEALKNQGLVVYTIVNRSLAAMVHDECDSLGLPCIDLLTPLLLAMARFIGHSPQETPGLLHSVDEEYFRRIEAIEFTVKHDDGQEVRRLHQADIVLVGVSRTSKTPLSIYLAHRGWRVANIPLVQGIAPPDELFEVPRERIAGLVIDPERLMELRSSRLKNLGQTTRSAYADYERISDELREAKKLFRKQGWAHVNVTGKALEETANEVLIKLNLK